MVALALAVALPLVSAAPALADSWGTPVRWAGPMSLDLLPTQIAFAPSGAAAVGFGSQDEDHPADSHGLLITRSPRGRLSGLRRVAGAREILGLAFDAKTLELLTGSSPAGQACCSSVQIRSSGGRSQTILRGLAGATAGRLLVLPGHAKLAALATVRGVWVWRSGDRAARRLTAAKAMPQTLAATALPGGRSVVAWTATNGQPGPGSPRSIEVAQGTAGRAPGSPHVVVQVAPGHEVDELGVAGATLGWVESWYDAAGAFHSEVVAADLGRPRRRRAFAVAGAQAAGLWFSADGRGDELLAWKTCDQLGDCTVDAAGRPAGRRFRPAQSLGAVDAGQSPAGGVGAQGQGLVAWIDQGHVYAADRRRAGGRFSAARLVSATNYAADPTVAFSPDGAALATWTQGTLDTSVMGAVHRGL